jgi:hypothetical protein
MSIDDSTFLAGLIGFRTNTCDDFLEWFGRLAKYPLRARHWNDKSTWAIPPGSLDPLLDRVLQSFRKTDKPVIDFNDRINKELKSFIGVTSCKNLDRRQKRIDKVATAILGLIEKKGCSADYQHAIVSFAHAVKTRFL